MNSKTISIHQSESGPLYAELARLLLEKAGALLIVIDEQARITLASASLEKLTGRRVQGASLHDFVLDFDQNLNFADMCGPERDGQILNLPAADGMPVSYHFMTRRVGDSIVLFGESTEEDLQLLRSELLAANNDLHDLSRELHQRNAQLEELNNLKNQFLGIAAHDLRNPIGIILSFSELVLDTDTEPLTDTQREILEMIRESSEFMLKLLHNLLDIAAIESGNLSLERVPVDLALLVRKNLVRNRLLADKKHIEIVEDVAHDMPTVLLDAGKIEQVLNNLVTNAIKFSNAGTTVTVCCATENENVLISVRDQGQGIPESEADKLFKPFSRTSVLATAGESSTGLGLAIVKRIIDGHGGSIVVESVVGEGTVFRISIPK
jgi:signal transduction histidine kinase